MLKLCHNLFEKFRDENKFEELEIVTGAPYLAFARENLLTVSNQIRELFEEKLVKITAQTLSGQMQNLIFSLERVAVPIKRLINLNRDFSKKKIGVLKSSVCVARHITAMTKSQINSNSVGKF